MAAPAKQDLIITRGDTETVVINQTTSDGVTPINVTGRTYAAQLRTSQDVTAIAGSFVCVVTNGANGQVTCTLTAASSEDLKPGYYYWDVQESASGVISTIIAGTVTVLADVTRL